MEVGPNEKADFYQVILLSTVLLDILKQTTPLIGMKCTSEIVLQIKWHATTHKWHVMGSNRDLTTVKGTNYFHTPIFLAA